jgi:hypothetical protein
VSEWASEEIKRGRRRRVGGGAGGAVQELSRQQGAASAPPPPARARMTLPPTRTHTCPPPPPSARAQRRTRRAPRSAGVALRTETPACCGGPCLGPLSRALRRPAADRDKTRGRGARGRAGGQEQGRGEAAGAEGGRDRRISRFNGCGERMMPFPHAESVRSTLRTCARTAYCFHGAPDYRRGRAVEAVGTCCRGGGDVL